MFLLELDGNDEQSVRSAHVGPARRQRSHQIRNVQGDLHVRGHASGKDHVQEARGRGLHVLGERMGVRTFLYLLIAYILFDRLNYFVILLRKRQDGMIHPKNFTHPECPKLSQL